MTNVRRDIKNTQKGDAAPKTARKKEKFSRIIKMQVKNQLREKGEFSRTIKLAKNCEKKGEILPKHINDNINILKFEY